MREPAAALYAFCRLADDAVDAVGAVGAVGAVASADSGKRQKDAVAALRHRLRLAYAGTPRDHTADRALAIVVARHAIPAALFEALLEGFEWDVQGRRYDTIESLLDYAARVAGSVGAMMALLMGVRSTAGVARACELGVAMQLSNIARDVGEDARIGRLYLPREWMVDAGLDPAAWLEQPRFNPALAGVVRRLLDAAEVLYRRVDAGVAELPFACRPGINAARYLYAEIGREVARCGLNSVDARARVSASRKAWSLLRSAVQITPSAAATELPPLRANRFLVDAAVPATAMLPADSPPRRSTAERLAWTLELFARLEQRDRLRGANRPARADFAA